MSTRPFIAATAGLAIVLAVTATLLTSPGATAESVKPTPHIFVPTTVAIEARDTEPAPTF